MKALIIISLISYSFNQYFLKNKNEKLSTTKSSGMLVINLTNFENNETIHLQFDAVNGNMSEYIKYEFRSPFDIPLQYVPLYYMKPIKIEKSETKVNDSVKITTSYYYDFVKKINEKYLIIKFLGFKGSYLEMKIISSKDILLIIFIIFFPIFIVSMIIYCIVKTILEIKNGISSIDKPLTTSNQEEINNNQTKYITPPSSDNTPSYYSQNYNFNYEPPVQSSIN